MICEKCQARDATVHLTLIGPSEEASRHHFCESCYPKARQELGRTFHEIASPPGTPPPEITPVRKPKIPAAFGTTCRKCGETTSDKTLAENLMVCPRCQYHFPLGARERIHSLVETFCFDELDADMLSVDAFNFIGVEAYGSKLVDYQKTTGRNDAVITGLGKIGPHRVGLAVMDFSFMGGSLGSVVGEKLTRLIEKSTEHALPVIIISASGGARPHEGLFSLMQMAKTCGAIEYHSQAGLPFISVLTNPTVAGVLASFASVGSLILAEPGAKIGFAGSRVITETTHAQLPPGFQTAEFLLDRGLLDAIVPRPQLKQRLIDYLAFMTLGQKTVAAV